MANFAHTSTKQALLAQHLGIRVDRATDTLPQTAAEDIFTIVGGRILLTGIVGEVTTVLGAVGNITLEHNPTAAGTTTAISTAAAGGALEAGSLISIEGTAATATTLAVGGAVAIQSKPLAVTAGTIAVRTSASNTGNVKWSLFYIPIDSGAYVTATTV